MRGIFWSVTPLNVLFGRNHRKSLTARCAKGAITKANGRDTGAPKRPREIALAVRWPGQVWLWNSG